MSDIIDDTRIEIEAAHASTVEVPSRVRKKRPIGLWFGLLWLGILLFHAAFASYLPWVRGQNQRVNGASNFAVSPGADFWFGSDQLGKDVFARCVYGARLALTICTVSILVGLLFGGTFGVLAGYFKGKTDRVISIFADALLAFPVIVFAMLIIGRFDALAASDIEFFGFGFDWLTRRWSVTIIFSILVIAPVSRIVRAQTLSLSEREYVLAARSVGARTPRVLIREIGPNLIPPMVSVVFTGIAILLAAEGGLAFVGYSVKPPDASWGLMINEARSKIDDAWWATLMPAFVLFMTVLAFNLVGDWVAKRFDIREAAL
ncbi:MAG TPA: ABC transporter permease [Ilumatobacteraceae bacterium]